VQLGGEVAIYEMSSSWDGTTFDLNLHLGVLKNEVPADRLVDYAKFRQELLDSLAAAAAKMGGGNTTPTPAAAATDSAAPELRRRDSMTPVPSTSGPVIFRIGEAVEAASLIKVVDPKYPKAAKDAHITGTLLFDAIIGGDGAVSQLDFVSGPAELKDAAEDAIHQWRYKPFRFNCRPTSVKTEIRIVYGKHGAEKYPPHY
jgi:outer membrane biosynthesis protein TonB